MSVLVLTALFTAAVLAGSRFGPALEVPRAAISVFLFAAGAIAISLAAGRAIARLRRQLRWLEPAAQIPLGVLGSAAGEVSFGILGAALGGELGNTGAAGVARRLRRCRVALLLHATAAVAGVGWIGVLCAAQLSRPPWFRALAAALR